MKAIIFSILCAPQCTASSSVDTANGPPLNQNSFLCLRLVVDTVRLMKSHSQVWVRVKGHQWSRWLVMNTTDTTTSVTDISLGNDLGCSRGYNA